MVDTIKTSLVRYFMNTTPSTTATYVRMGSGVASAKLEMNPETTKQTDITEDNARVSVDSYAPTLPIKQIAKNADAIFEFIDALRKARAVNEAAETDIVEVDAYETGGPTAYPARKQTVSIQIDSFGGDGGKPAEIEYTINYNGDPVAGTFNASTLAFTPS